MGGACGRWPVPGVACGRGLALSPASAVVRGHSEWLSSRLIQWGCASHSSPSTGQLWLLPLVLTEARMFQTHGQGRGWGSSPETWASHGAHCPEVRPIATAACLPGRSREGVLGAWGEKESSSQPPSPRLTLHPGERPVPPERAGLVTPHLQLLVANPCLRPVLAREALSKCFVKLVLSVSLLF